MKIGSYKGTISLLWDNSKDRNHDEAIQALKRKTNGIKQLVIKMDKEAKYPTQQLIKWFMNQRWSNGYQYTHKLIPAGTHKCKYSGKEYYKPEHISRVSRKKPYKYQVWISTLQILTPNGPVFLRPGVHIENTDQGISEQKQAYTQIAGDWKYVPEPVLPIKIEPKNPFNEFLIDYLITSYEVDEYSLGLIEVYIENKIPISRMPQDDVIYAEFIKLGIAPAYSSLEYQNEQIYTEEDIDYTNYL